MKTLNISNREVIIDLEDYDKVKGISWYIANTGYVVHKGRDWTGYMHRIILGYEGPLIVDHIDQNKLNNQKSNLRLVTQKENQHNRKAKQCNNTSGFTGVCHTRSGWQAYINYGGKRIHIGYYLTAERAYDAREYYIAYHKLETTNK